MRKAVIFVIFSIILILVASCGNQDSSPVEQITTINDLIYDQEKIVNVEITKEQEGIFVWNIQEKAEIEEFLETTSNIPVERLTREQDLAFMNKGLKFVEKGLYRVDFYVDSKRLSGGFLIWTDGKIYIRDNNSP